MKHELDNKLVDENALGETTKLADFPDLHELVTDSLAGVGLLPLDPPPIPQRSRSTSARLRQRHKLKMQVWRAAVALTDLVNSMDQGRVHQKFADRYVTHRRDTLGRMKAGGAVELAERMILQKAASVVRARRDFGLTGAQGKSEQATSALLRASISDCGYSVKAKIKQISLQADLIQEPDPKAIPVNMFPFLPPEDVIFYSEECNVIDDPSQVYYHCQRDRT